MLYPTAISTFERSPPVTALALGNSSAFLDSDGPGPNKPEILLDQVVHYVEPQLALADDPAGRFGRADGPHGDARSTTRSSCSPIHFSDTILIEMAMKTKTEHPHLVRVRGVCGGKPVIEGTRIAVWLIVSWFKQGYTPEEIQKMYPHLTLAQIHDALSYYYDHQAEVEKDIRANNPPEEQLEKLRAEWQRLNST